MDRQRIRTENDAATVVKALVDGIRYCHDHHIAHRDLKLENILYEHKGSDAGIKVIHRDLLNRAIYAYTAFILRTVVSPPSLRTSFMSTRAQMLASR